MNDQTDQQLLREYLERQSEAAFAAIVHRYVDLVYSAAIRLNCDAHAARDVTQGVFVALAQNARQLTDRPALAGWLHGTARNLAVKVIRSDARRRAREQEAAIMNELLSTHPDADWEDIAPHLDDALGELSESDRDAVLLRYFKNQDLRTVGATLGISDDAAQKRVSRAVERLRDFLVARGVTIGAGGLVVVISANGVQAAPAGLALTISTAAVLTGTSLATSATLTASKAIAMTALQKTLVTATIAVLAGAGIYEARQAAQLRGQLEISRQERMSMSEQMAELKAGNQQLSNQVLQIMDLRALSKAQFDELLKLRGTAGVAQADSRELAKLKSTVAGQIGKTPDYLTNAMAMGLETAERWKLKNAQATLDHMKKALNLTDDQARAISDIQLRYIHGQTEMAMNAITGKASPEQRQAVITEGSNQDDEIKALLTSDQLAAYPEYLRTEKAAAAESSANNEAGQIAGDFSLSKEQQEQIHMALYQLKLNESASGISADTIAAAKKNGNLSEVVSLTVALSKSQLEEKLRILGDILTPEQISAYRTEQMKKLDMMLTAMNMLVPQKPVAPAN